MDLFLRKTRQRIASFSLSPEWLLRTMKRTRSVIGGSIPFHLIVNDRFTPSNLDLYAPASQEERLLNIFQTEAGFSLIDSSYARIKSVRLKATHRLEKGRSIVILRIARGENAVIPIIYSSTTALMNFVTAHGIVCAYPKLTLRGRALLNFGNIPDTRHMELVLLKYKSRGVWHGARTDIPKDLQHKCFHSASCPSTIRSIHDAGCLVIRFPSQNEEDDDPLKNLVFYDRHTVIWSLGRCLAKQQDRHGSFFVHSEPYTTIRYQTALT
ncbi:hypothetical protein C8J57DRAFT_1104628 [Mycena rebaudengoi]|nr:hypothetical protein C8J57DRAFT_1105692 [Mycena rebaudengoi]KAJ7199279.1 hypothetical protein C8J57DRAFT_1104628 [Mycena rebaudengoi]